MPVLLIILATTLALAWRAGIVRRCLGPAEAGSHEDAALVDACARSSLLVLGSLLGLLVLGVVYGNVLGASGSVP